MYRNKKFTDLMNGRVVQVIDEFEDIVILDNKSKLKLNKLLDKNLYDEYIDPKDFFRNESLVNAFTEKIRSLPNEVLKKDPDRFDPSDPPLLKNYGDPMRPAFDEPAVLPYDPELEKRQLMEKARNMYGDVSDQSQKQYESLRNILEDSENVEVPKENYEIMEEEIVEQVINKPRIENKSQQVTRSEYQSTQQTDPIIQMFRNAKRNVDFDIELRINNKIPRLDFIEMMEDSYNTSIIDFLAEEFTNDLLLNPQIIKDKIKNQISEKVYGNASKASEEIVEKKTIRKKLTNKSND